MKKFLSYGLMGCVMGFSSLTAMAQTQVTAERGDTVEFKAPDGCKAYQWQVSSDLKNFYPLPDGKVQNLRYPVSGPGYYRVKVTSQENKTSYADTIQVSMTKVKYADGYTLSGGAHGYIETLDGQPGSGGINLPEDRDGDVAGTSLVLSNWTNNRVMPVYYINHPKGVMDTNMFMKVNKGSKVVLEVTVWDPTKMTEPLGKNIVAVVGTGQLEEIPMICVNIPSRKYYRYQIKSLMGCNNIVSIDKFHHYSNSAIKSYKSGYLSSPSVHLNRWGSTKPGTSTAATYDWCYEEVMMPEEANIPGTYVMSLGVLHGYMGIQMNGWNGKEPKHDVIFSMWDDGNVDNDPNLPDHLRAVELDFNPGAKIERFRNEGTGVKTFLPGNHWKCGTFVQFLTNSRPETKTYKVVENGKERTFTQRNTLVSTWFNAQDGKGWQYMSTLRLPNQVRYFDSWYSFLENYNYPTGQILRKGFYRNGYVRHKGSKKWIHYNKVNFGHTDGSGAVGSRDDFGQGVSDEIEGAFFMTTGGYIPSKVTGKQVPLNKVDTPVDTIDLSVFEARIEQAIAHEKQQEDMVENFRNHKLDKTGWKVIKFSSQETTGEGTNGRASQIVDNDLATYWHSAWQSGSSKCPHYFVIDMKEDYKITGMQITMSGGADRYIKGYNLYVSPNNRNWFKVHSDADAPVEETFQFMLDVPANARYLKLEVTDARCGYGDHVRINEIEVTGELVPTGIGSVESSTGKFDVTCGAGELSVKSHAAMSDLQVALYSADGACLYSHNYASVAEGGVLSIPMLAAPKGVYVVTCKSAGVNYTRQVVWNE